MALLRETKFPTRQFQWHSKRYEEFLCPKSMVKTYAMREKQCVANYTFAYKKFIKVNFANKIDWYSKVLQQENGKITIVDERYYNPGISNIYCHF